MPALCVRVAASGRRRTEWALARPDEICDGVFITGIELWRTFEIWLTEIFVFINVRLISCVHKNALIRGHEDSAPGHRPGV
jgi:hypothetical protein